MSARNIVAVEKQQHHSEGLAKGPHCCVAGVLPQDMPTLGPTPEMLCEQLAHADKELLLHRMMLTWKSAWQKMLAHADKRSIIDSSAHSAQA
eukprot:1161878-Pelagomonas_calceolata.AAC.1